MKRLFVLGFMLLFSFTLAGCEFIPDEVIEQASEEVCREDPDNPVCDIENMDNLEDQVVLELFEQVRTYYTNEELDARCETVFSVTNVDLLDRCRSEETKLFPDEIKDYEVEEIEETSEGYQITLINRNSNERYAFLILIDGDSMDDYRISSWSYEAVMMEYAGIPEELIVAQVRTFLSDFTNPDISDDEVCLLWVGEDEDCDDSLSANRVKFKAAAELSKTVNISNPDLDGDGLLDVLVTYDFRGHVTVLKLSLQVMMVEEEVVLMMKESAVETTLDEQTEGLFDAFIDDVKNEEMMTNEVCRVWYDGVDDDCDGIISEARTKFKAGAELSKSVYITDPDSDGDGLFDGIIELKLDGHVTVLKLSFIEIVDEDVRNIVFTKLELADEDQDEASLEERVMMEFDAFIEDVKNEELSIGEVCRIWYDGVDDDCDGIISEARTKFKAGAELSKSVNISDPDSDGDGLFDGILEMTLDGHVTVLKLSFKEMMEEDMSIIMITKLELIQDGGGDCDDTDCDIYPGEMKDFYQSYLDVYNNEESTREELNAFFVEPPSDEFYLLREQYLSAGNILVLVDVVGPVEENTYIMVHDVVDVITSRGGSREAMKVRVIKEIDKASPKIMEAIFHDPDDDDDGILTADEVAIVEELKQALKDETMVLKDVCMTFFGKEEATCPMIEEDYQVEDIEYLQTNSGILLRIRKRPDLLSSDQIEIIDTYHAFFYRNEEGTLVLELVEAKYFMYEEEVQGAFDTLLAGTIDESRPIDEVCTEVTNDTQVVCAEMRRIYLGNDPVVLDAEMVIVDGLKQVRVMVEYNVGDERMTNSYYVEFVLDENSLQQLLSIKEVE
ncbi:MAG: hypothetical protein ACVCEJ_03185 [Candidatus Izemoplasmataceae bacterium]